MDIIHIKTLTYAIIMCITHPLKNPKQKKLGWNSHLREKVPKKNWKIKETIKGLKARERQLVEEVTAIPKLKPGNTRVASGQPPTQPLYV